MYKHNFSTLVRTVELFMNLSTTKYSTGVVALLGRVQQWMILIDN